MDTAYIIKRSPKRKKLTITVERDRSVVVHAPESTPEETIQARISVLALARPQYTSAPARMPRLFALNPAHPLRR